MTGLGPAQRSERWDEVAEGYAELIDPDLARYSKRALELAPVGEGDRVLDVAAGAGSLSVRAAKQGANVVAIDFSPELVSLLSDRARREGLGNLEAHVMDGQDLDVDDASFDAAFSMFGLMLFPDRASGFQEMHRVLEPGGRAAVSAWVDPSEIEWFTLFAQALETAVPELDPPPPPFIDLTDPSRLAKEMGEAGFSEVEVHTVEAHTRSQGPSSTWRKLAEANPVVPTLIDALGQDAVEELRSAFLDIYRDRYGEGPVDLESPAHIAVGLRP